ncbi:hypothetical protein [Mycolicibacterium wolinskyi]|uniref:hypothetical protein n=1 Tax=Mycolicibacterium wolinskyi TaxID=59750 RepID=UPI0039178480
MSAVPSGSGGALPSRSGLEEWSTSHLSDAAAAWRSAAAASSEAFDQHRKNIVSPGGTTWEGDAKDAALTRVTVDIGVVGSQNGALLEAAGIAENGVNDINAAKREALDAINAAEEDGFTVGEDLSVTDGRRYDVNTVVERNKAATEHAEDIRWYAERLMQTDTLVGQRLQTKAGELEGIRFDGDDQGGDATVHLVDNTIKLNPEDDKPGNEDEQPHPGLPIPEQKRSIEGSRGTPQSKDILKPPDGRHEKPPPGTKVGAWGEDIRVNKPKGPLIAKGETGEHGGALWEKVGGAEGPVGEYDWRAEVLGAHGEAGYELRKDGATGSAQGRASLAEGEANATTNLGPVEVKGHLDGAIGARGSLSGTAGPSGGQVGGDVAAGIHSSQKIEFNSHGVGITGGITEIAGAGAASDFHVGTTDDGKFAIGGHYGRAWGFGATALFEVTIDPKEVTGNLKKLLEWFAG